MQRDVSGVPAGLGSTITTPLTIELERRGHHVTIYTISNELKEERIYNWGRLRVFVGPSRVFGSPRDFYRIEIEYLKRVIRADAPDFVNAHWTYEFALGALGSGVPTITTIHDLPWNVFRYYRDRCRAVRILLSYLVAAKGRNFTAVSPDAARHFGHWIRPGTSVNVIPNFLSNEVFELGRSEEKPSHRDFTFVTILQGWSRRKNGSCALKAFQIFRKSSPNARLIMVGSGYEEGGPAQRWAAEQGLSGRVTFQGVMQHDLMLRFVQEESDVLIHPSFDEAFSVTVLECMALKKPVIGGIRTPGLRWVLGSGEVGILVDVHNPESVADAMQRLASDGALRQRLSVAAYEKAWSQFRADVVVPQYEALYRDFDALAQRSLADPPPGGAPW
jgi:glycosyltransferase involved in cell wall biosynthesis